jgi:hypothetical protein
MMSPKQLATQLKLALLGCLCVSCVAVTLPSGAKMAGLGADFNDVELTPERFASKTVTTSAAFLDVTKRLKQAFDAYLMYQGLTFLGGKYYDKLGAEISSAETIRLNELSNAKSAAEAAEKTKQLGMMLGAAPPATP